MAQVQNVVMVLTGNSLETMFSAGGSGNWVANASRVRRCEYIVAVRHGFSSFTQDNRTHDAAFMIGKVSGVTEVEDNRIVINFSEYAEIDIARAWPGNRNPVTYTSTDQLGIDPAKLTWLPFPMDRVAQPEVKPLTIDEAKRGIARALGIAPECIEITIRA
ncbi:MAG: hypothetical protein ABI782_10320 [Anaerolineaceae bacterium]